MPGLTPEELAAYDETRQPSLIATSIIFLVLCDIAVLLRLANQFRQHKRLNADDYAIVLAAVFSNITGALYLNATYHGLGLHIYRVIAEDPNPPQNLLTMFEALYFNAVFTGPMFAAIKISLLLFYRRTFLVHQRWLEIAWWVNFVYVILVTLGMTLFYICQCIPPDYYWMRVYLMLGIPPPEPVEGQCNSATPLLVSLPLIFSLISDFGILLLPVATLSKLKMPMLRKIGMIVIFSLGLLACICEAVRIYLELKGSVEEDVTYDNCDFVIFTFAQGNVAIVAACAPFIASQWVWTVKKVRSSLGSSRSGSGSGSTGGWSSKDSSSNHTNLTNITLKSGEAAEIERETRNMSFAPSIGSSQYGQHQMSHQPSEEFTLPPVSRGKSYL